MVKQLQAIRGMNDILPQQTRVWQYFESKIRLLLAGYGYEEIRVPIVEQSDLFSRGIGMGTDIVEKEMYTFTDRNGESLSLRPEATAGVVRSGIQQGLLFNQSQRLWTSGPMFRYERPQKGRYRQFHQVSVEAYGMEGPDIDAELIMMTARLWRELGILDHVSLELNSLGTLEARQQYREILVKYFQGCVDQLDDDSQRRLEVNPLRILDSKHQSTQKIVTEAPLLSDYLDDDSKNHFEELKQILDSAGIAYTINQKLVRGLDYYGRTVFEWVTDSLGAQGAVCAGGRYDSLVGLLGGKPTPAVGFAVGVERLIMMLDTLGLIPDEVNKSVDVSVVVVGDAISQQALPIVESIRNELPALRIMINCGGSFKGQMKRADRSGADFALIIGIDEIQSQTFAIKSLRTEVPQQHYEFSALINFLREHI